ncbi:MAG: DUF2273 domain-containing protein [Halanaerobium sp.]
MNKDHLKEEYLNYFSENPRKVIGALIGLLIGILILTIGFLKTIILALTTFLGYYLGSRYNIEEDLKDLLMRIIPERFK